MTKLENNRYILQPGELKVAKHPAILETILGSCVAVVLWDSKAKIAGMNHYIFANLFKDRIESNNRFGEISVPNLIKGTLREGASIENLIAIIVGGASNPQLNSIVGNGNIDLAREILNSYGIRIKRIDVGGTHGRKVVFDTNTKEVRVSKIEITGPKDKLNK